MSTRNPTDWMWAQACELIEQAERMHRQFFRLTTNERVAAVWEPPIDVFEDEREVVIIIALPGVPEERIEVSHVDGEIVIRADGRLPFAGTRFAVQRLEIPYGAFERRIRLPAATLDGGTRELADGCLILRLHKKGWMKGL